MRHVHVIGAGLAGLSAAVRLSQSKDVDVTVHEASGHAGGRCRSYYDPRLDLEIDNGAHLMVHGNVEVRDYLDQIGATDEVYTADRAVFPFMDIAGGGRWVLDLGRGRGRLALARTVLSSKCQMPGFGVVRLMRDVGALRWGQGKTVVECVGRSPLFASFWEPLTLAVLNTPPGEGAAALLYRVLTLSVLKGGAFARPMLPRRGLGPALIDPALNVLQRNGARVHLNRRVRGLTFDGGRVATIEYANGAEVLGDQDAVIVAVPPHAAQGLLDDLSFSAESHAILNVHFKLSEAIDASPLTGLVNAQAHWLFVRGNVVSVTISAADAWMERDGEAIAHDLWQEVAKVLKFGDASNVPVNRVIKERRATFAQTPQSVTQRPGVKTRYQNLFLAGDWTDTDLPATIEGALKSGRMACRAVLGD